MKNENKSPALPKNNSAIGYSMFGKGVNPVSATPEASSLFDSCLIDPSGRQFACMHRACREFPTCFKNELLVESVDFHELSYHPDDRRLWCDSAFPDILRFISSESITDLSDYRFIFNHRYIRKDGSVSQFMHEGCLKHTSDSPVLHLNLNVFFEIADIKSDETMILTIFRYSNEFGYRKVFSKVYSDKLTSKLTARELEIIKLFEEGLSSKMIAEKLNLSIHTVKNHKRNCMDKTQTHNISELIHVCIQNHWL